MKMLMEQLTTKALAVQKARRALTSNLRDQ